MKPQVETRKAKNPKDEILGYSLSVYVLGKEDMITPIRYIHHGLRVLPEQEDEQIKPENIGYSYEDGEEIYFLNENLGYKLSVADAALGSRFYALLQSRDGGSTWETINPDPFLNSTGTSSGITFIDEDLVLLNESETYNPFDLPQMPYEKDGKLLLLVGQGQDGDYNGGIKALYESKDRGRIWEYVKRMH